MLYIGVDLGTSAVKLLLMDGEGKILNIVSKEYPLSFPHPGWSEQDPADWVRQTEAGIRDLTAGFDASQVAGIGCGGQMHGLVALDKDDNVLRPAILWNDGRTAEEVEYLNGVIGREKLSQYTANIAFAGFTAPKLLWMKKHEPDLFTRIAKIMLPKDYLNYVLTGVHCTDVSDASGMLLFDVEHKCWSREMLDICGVREDQMAHIFESYEVVFLGYDVEDLPPPSMSRSFTAEVPRSIPIYSMMCLLICRPCRYCGWMQRRICPCQIFYKAIFVLSMRFYRCVYLNALTGSSSVNYPATLW